MQKRKILFITTKSDIGGAQKHINLLIQYLSDQHEFILCSGSTGSLSEQVRSMGLTVHIVPQLTNKLFLPALFSISRIIKNEQPDLIHTHSAVASFVGRIAGRLAGIKTLYTVHGWHFVPNSVWKRRYFGWLLELIVRPFTNAWIAVSEYDLELGVNKGVIDRERAWVVPNGVEDETFELGHLSDSEKLRLVFVGRASFQKNCLEAIDIVQACPDDVTLTMYVTSGDHLPSLYQAVSDRGLEERITLITDNPDASHELQKYSAMLLTSRYEGMPLCVLEAMRAGLPVVASDVCGVSEIVEHGGTGYLYPLNQTGEAVNYLVQLLNVETRHSFGERAQQRFVKNHTAELMARRTAEIYQKVLGA